MKILFAFVKKVNGQGHNQDWLKISFWMKTSESESVNGFQTSPTYISLGKDNYSIALHAFTWSFFLTT